MKTIKAILKFGFVAYLAYLASCFVQGFIWGVTFESRNGRKPTDQDIRDFVQKAQ